MYAKRELKSCLFSEMGKIGSTFGQRQNCQENHAILGM